MKGLLINNYYSMQENMNLSALIAVCVGVLAAFGGNAFLSLAISSAIFIFPLNIGSSLQTDETSKWNKFEITMPVSRKMIVQCKYISFLMLVLIGIIFSFAILLLFIVLGREIKMQTVAFSYLNGLSLALFTGALMYPFLLKLGALKSELIIVISVILSLGCTVGITYIMTLINKDLAVKLSLSSSSAVTLIVAIILFIASYFISVKLHAKKEF